VGVDGPLGLVQLRAVRRDQLPPGLGPTAPDALERGPIGHQIPEAFLQAEGGLHDELGQVMRQVDPTRPGSHRRSLEPAMSGQLGPPRAQPAIV
jgi:hypothetical protein